MVTGGCYCGRVRYEAAGALFHATLCHCADCRRIAAAPMVAWFSVASAGLRFVAGAPKYFASSAKVTRGFCAACGTPLTYQHADFADEIDITTCSLDSPEHVAPRDHTYTRERLPWVRTADGLPQFPAARADG
jgi:hypothetical protein